MTLSDCLLSLTGYGVALLNKGGRLVIQSANLTLNDQQKFILKSYKPLLLVILPTNIAYRVGVVLDAVEAYQERFAIMQEAEDIPLISIELIALQQARQLLSTTVSQT